jgi:phage terminase large subunit-like protein
MFNQDYADFAINFVECLKHVDGKWYGVPFDLLDWQKNALTEFYGTVKQNDARQYQYLYLEIPKKNGKSELAAALGLYHTFADGEMHGEVYVCAADKANAGIIFNAALGMLEQNPTLKKRAKVKESQKEIHDKVSGTFMKVLSAEAYSKHGYKPSCVIFDELHAQPNRDLWDIMTFGSGSARFQPVWIVLTTAGDDPDRGSIGWEVHEKANKILQYRKGNTEGNYDNPVWLPIIYGLGDLSPDESKELNIYNEDLWYKCNPSLGKTIEIDTLRQEALDAKQSEYSERLFRWLRLNQWISIKAVGWLPLTLYDKTEAPIPDLKRKRCYPGLDLSSTTDLTDLTLVFPPQEGLPYWFTLFVPWITEEKMRERSRRDHVDFEKWVKDGYVKTTPGDCIDFDFVESEIYAIADKYNLKLLGCDPYLSRMLTQHVMKRDIDVVEIPQDMKNLSPAMKKIEELLIKGEMKHEKNPCARWCFGNVRVATDGNENIKPMKNKSTGRIDVTVAWIIAMATALLNEKPNINDTILSDDWSM